MTDSLAHRGPDGHGLEIFNTPHATVALGQRRLSIIDLSDSGKQPMTYKGLTISYNGEVFNYKEIQKELSELGHTFEGNSDTEVLLHAYEEWGADCISRFIGMFAFVIYDQNKKTLFCARHRAGI